MGVEIVIPGEGTESLLMNREDKVPMQGEVCTVESQAEAAKMASCRGRRVWWQEKELERWAEATVV